MIIPKVVYEDNHLLILYKPSGWLVQGDRTGDVTLTDWGKQYVKEKYGKPGEVFLHPVHRIDRPVSGLVVFGRTSKATERMNRLFREDQIDKTYLAIVRGIPGDKNGTLVHWLTKDERKNISKAHNREVPNSKKAELSYELIGHIDGLSLLIVKPKTGRPHQIRAQLMAIGCVIQGDLKYGFPTPNSDKNISLHAVRIGFEHPVRKEPLSCKCKPSTEDWKNFLPQINELDQTI